MTYLLDPGGPEMLAAREAHWCARTPMGLAVLRYRPVLPAGRSRHYQMIRSVPGGTSVPGARRPASGDRRLRSEVPCAAAG